MNSDAQARRTLDEVAAFRARTRAARPSFAAAVVAVALLAAGAMPFYIMKPLEDDWSQPTRFAALAGYSGVMYPELATLYWLVAIPLLYAVLAGYFRWSGSRSGVKVQTRTWIASGLVLFVACVAVLYLPELVAVPGNATGRGLTPLLPVAAALLVWGIAVRAAGLTAIAAAGVVACFTAVLYNVENLLPPGSVDYRYRLVLNLAVPGLVYLIGAVLMAASRTRPRVRP